MVSLAPNQNGIYNHHIATIYQGNIYIYNIQIFPVFVMGKSCFGVGGVSRNHLGVMPS